VNRGGRQKAQQHARLEPVGAFADIRRPVDLVAVPALGAAAALLSMPWGWLENVVWRRPALGMIFGRKPPKRTN
jgi:hypothetical protein